MHSDLASQVIRRHTSRDAALNLIVDRRSIALWDVGRSTSPSLADHGQRLLYYLTLHAGVDQHNLDVVQDVYSHRLDRRLMLGDLSPPSALGATALSRSTPDSSIPA